MTDAPRTGSRRAASAAAGPMRLHRPAPTAHPWAAAVLILAGVMALSQLLLPWRSASAPDPAATDAVHAVGVGGWRFYRALHDLPGPTFELVLARFVMLGVAGAGLALVLLGLLTLLPIDHRPVGTAAFLASGAAALGPVFLLARSRSLFDVGLNTLFDQARPGFYLLLAAGLVGLVGAFAATSARSRR